MAIGDSSGSVWPWTSALPLGLCFLPENGGSAWSSGVPRAGHSIPGRGGPQTPWGRCRGAQLLRPSSPPSPPPSLALGLPQHNPQGRAGCGRQKGP